MYITYILPNGDTFKQILARSRYLLYKHKSKWTPTQLLRAEILFENYPELEQACYLSQQLSAIFNLKKNKQIVYKKLARWYQNVEQIGFKSFLTIANKIENNYDQILNYFNNRSTNASAEAFNAKIKVLRRQFRGVRNTPFFLYHLAMIYAYPPLTFHLDPVSTLP